MAHSYKYVYYTWDETTRQLTFHEDGAVASADAHLLTSTTDVTDNKLYYPLSGATIDAQRGYFQLAGLTVPEAVASRVVLNLGNELITDIQQVPAVRTLNTADWYDLSGRKLVGKPTAKGVYINSGRVMVVK